MDLDGTYLFFMSAMVWSADRGGFSTSLLCWSMLVSRLSIPPAVLDAGFWFSSSIVDHSELREILTKGRWLLSKK